MKYVSFVNEACDLIWQIRSNRKHVFLACSGELINIFPKSYKTYLHVWNKWYIFICISRININQLGAMKQVQSNDFVFLCLMDSDVQKY